MDPTRRTFLKGLGAAFAGITLSDAWLDAVQAAAGSPDLPPATDRDLHILTRLTWGARPEDLAYLRAIGYEAWLDGQLDPALPDPEGDAVREQNPILGLDRHAVHSLGFDGRVHNAILRGMVELAVSSRRQLFERMVEFWTDHFNIPAGDLAHDLVVMHREVIRRHALGRFRDLAIGTAQSPAMLYYLDQTYSTLEHPNENYARELLELHTLGVDGGYTESDVKEAARALTGWTVQDGTETGFYFDAETHDSEPKTILGHDMPGGRGIEDGLHLLSLVVNHPATAHHLCRKLCIRFVSDDPPDALIESAAAVWMDQNGAIVPVLRHILTSDAFFQSAGQKLRRPLDFAIGAFRATGTEVANVWLLREGLENLGQLPYGWNPPNGYPDAAGAWINSAGLLARWNVALALTHRAWSEPDSGLRTRLDLRVGTPATVGEFVDQVAERVFGAAMLPDDARAAFVAFAGDGAGPESPVTPGLFGSKLGMLFGLMLAAPIYQWR